MPKKRSSPEQIVVVLHQIEALISQGKAAPVTADALGRTEETETSALRFEPCLGMKK